MASFSQPDAEINALQGDALKAHITHYASNQLTYQDDETIEVEVMQLDHNLTLPACATPIDIAMSRDGHSNYASSVKLACQESPQWNVFVPINVKIITETLVANRLIRAGETLTADDITFEKHDKNRLMDGFFKNEQAVVGLVARHSISAGTVLTKNNTKQLPLIKKNQTITLALRTGGVEIDMMGIAKSDGYLNDTIKVLNPSSKKIIDAIVKNSGKAEINY